MHIKYRLIVYYGPYHLYIVKFKKRPTKHCGLTRHRLLPFEHCFEVLTWSHFTIADTDKINKSKTGLVRTTKFLTQA